jgi:hypothetical protein
MSFNAETQMRDLLLVKGKTRGLNTEKLGGRNCHIWLAPLALPENLRGCALAQDRRVKVRTAEVPILDMNQAINCQERFSRLVTKEADLLSQE